MREREREKESKKETHTQRERERERERARLLAQAPFVFLRTARDVFGSRFVHIKRQMSFYGPPRHPGTACRLEDPVGDLMPELS